MVKCRIRNVKERKIWSQNFKRDKTQLERSKGNENSRIQSTLSSRASNGIQDFRHCFSTGKHLMGAGRGSTFIPTCWFSLFPCSSLQDLCCLKNCRQNTDAELCGRGSGAGLIDILKPLLQLSHACC